MTKCAREGCERAATHIPRVNVPATGHALDTHQPIGLCLNLKLCKDHALDFSAAGQFGPGAPGDLRKIIEIMCAGRARPDFDRAFTTALRLDHPEALALEKAMASKH